MTRVDQLKTAVGNNETLFPLIQQIVYLEGELEKLEKLPKIRFNPDKPEQQKITPAAKLYKEYLQQYVNCIKLLEKDTDDGGEEISPLRAWIASRGGGS